MSVLILHTTKTLQSSEYGESTLGFARQLRLFSQTYIAHAVCNGTLWHTGGNMSCVEYVLFVMTSTAVVITQGCLHRNEHHTMRSESNAALTSNPSFCGGVIESQEQGTAYPVHCWKVVLKAHSTSWGQYFLENRVLQGRLHCAAMQPASTKSLNSLSTSFVPRTYSRFFLACSHT